MTVLADLKTYMGQAASRHADPVLLDVIATETAAQARKCRLPDDAIDPAVDYPADLYEALLRRCQRNLALRGLPLGLTELSSSDESTRSFVPGRDPEISRLEGPHRKWVVG